MNLQKQPIGKNQKLKPKVCKICKGTFEPRSSTQSVCGFSCAVEQDKRNKAKISRQNAQVKRKEHRAAINKLKPRGYYVAAAQRAFNAYIRLRDEKMPCICCGKHRNGYDAGHYLARSIRPELRFNEDNVQKQAKYCNNYNKGRAAATFRDGMIERIGLERVLALEAPHPPAKWTIPELQAIAIEYRAKAKGLSDTLGEA